MQLGRNVGVAQDLVQRLFDEFGLSFLDHQHRLLAAAEVDHLAVDDRVGHVHHIERHARLAPDIGKSGLAQRGDDAVIHAALHDDADIVGIAVERLVHAARVDEFDRGRPAVLDLLLLVEERGGRQHDAVGVARRLIERAGKRKGGADIVAGGEAAVHMTGAYPHLQHDGRIRRLGQFEGIVHGLDDHFLRNRRMRRAGHNDLPPFR